MLKKIKKEQCNGCHACKQICPRHCIKMTIDSEGFWYPQIHTEDCINCGLCQKVCSSMMPLTNNTQWEEVIAYAAKNKDEEIRKDSSSGGVFTEIAKYVIAHGGVVFGAAFDEDFNVKHTYVDSVEELHRFRGSKYVQSAIGNTYKQAENFLKEGRLVLFSGTPCQIAGLLAFLRNLYENLITQDLICHGVPSPKVWNIYKDIREKEGAIKKVSFRDKTDSWKNYSVSFLYQNNEIDKEEMSQNMYMRAFLRDLCLRTSCYACGFKTRERLSDITLADYWGIQKIHPEMDDDKGTSLVFVNSEKGRRIFEEIRKNFVYFETDKEKAIENNLAMIKSVAKPKNREKYLRKVTVKNFEVLTKKYINPPFYKRIECKLKAIAKRILKGEK